MNISNKAVKDAGTPTADACNCSPGDAYGHHVWCYTYRPEGMTDADWDAALEATVPFVVTDK